MVVGLTRNIFVIQFKFFNSGDQLFAITSPQSHARSTRRVHIIVLVRWFKTILLIQQLLRFFIRFTRLKM